MKQFLDPPLNSNEFPDMSQIVANEWIVQQKIEVKSPPRIKHKKRPQSSLKLTNNKRAPNKKKGHNNTLSRGAVPPARRYWRAIREGETGEVIGRKSFVTWGEEESNIWSERTSCSEGRCNIHRHPLPLTAVARVAWSSGGILPVVPAPLAHQCSTRLLHHEAVYDENGDDFIVLLPVSY